MEYRLIVNTDSSIKMLFLYYNVALIIFRIWSMLFYYTAKIYFGGANMLKKIKLSTVVSLCFMLFSLFYFYYAMKLKLWSSRYAPGPGFIPRWVSGIMFILSVIAFINSFKEDGITLDKVLPASRASRINLYVCWGGLIFFLIFVNKLGFVITSSILLTALFSRGAKWPKATLLGIIVSICCFVIFKIILQVQIPVNRFGW